MSSNATANTTIPVTLIPGDGIGPECVTAAQRILEAAGAPIEWDVQEAGAEVFKKGLPSGVPPETMDSIARTRVALKGPLETPVGFGEKSANVTLRKLFETYANVRPIREMPGVKTPYSGRGVDLVIVRENVEDLYAGIEYMQTPGVAECLKLISVKGSEKIARFAFEYARSEGRASVACTTKANIMKMTEGTLKRVFEQVAPDYPDIESWHVIIDNCAHQLVKRPEQYEVIVATNMNGDIISDLSSALIGGLGYAPSANIGNEVAIFEAVHGSAPKYAGKNVINPDRRDPVRGHDAPLPGAVRAGRRGRARGGRDARVGRAARRRRGVRQGSVHHGLHRRHHLQPRQALRDVDRPRPHAVEAPPGRPRSRLREAHRRARSSGWTCSSSRRCRRASSGASLMELTADTKLSLKMIGSRGTKVFPPTGAITDTLDHWRARFIIKENPGNLPDEDVHELLERISSRHRWMHIEKLQEFDGELGFTRDQGEN